MKNSKSKKVYCFFGCPNFRRKDKKNEKHRRKNFNGGRRNQTVAKQKKTEN